MSIESYPLSHLSQLARKAQEVGTSGIKRNWTGNDRNARNHNGIVSLNETPLRLCLYWQKDTDEPAQFIGIFDLELRKLLTEQCVRIEPRKQSELRLRFYHDFDGVIYIQMNRRKPRLPIGKVH